MLTPRRRLSIVESLFRVRFCTLDDTHSYSLFGLTCQDEALEASAAVAQDAPWFSWTAHSDTDVVCVDGEPHATGYVRAEVMPSYIQMIY